MPNDKGQQYLQAIHNHTRLTGLKILEIGCGSGEMTRTFATEAAYITAVDSDHQKLEQAQAAIPFPNVTFRHTDEEKLIASDGPYDMAIYTLSLHHIAADNMHQHLLSVAAKLKPGAPILVIEPGESGSFMAIKKEFGAGSGDESELCRAALAALETLPGFTLNLRYTFNMNFHFADEDDFCRSKLPAADALPEQKLCRLKSLLAEQRQPEGIILTAQRWLYRLQPEK